MQDAHIIESILQLLEHDNGVTRSITESSYMLPYALRTLSNLAPKMPEQFVKHNGAVRLLKLLEDSMIGDANSKIILEIVRTITLLITTKSPILMADFHAAGAINLILSTSRQQQKKKKKFKQK